VAGIGQQRHRMAEKAEPYLDDDEAEIEQGRQREDPIQRDAGMVVRMAGVAAPRSGSATVLIVGMMRVIVTAQPRGAGLVRHALTLRQGGRKIEAFGLGSARPVRACGSL